MLNCKKSQKMNKMNKITFNSILASRFRTFAYFTFFSCLIWLLMYSMYVHIVSEWTIHKSNYGILRIKHITTSLLANGKELFVSDPKNRPWFMKNGTLYPNYEIARDLAIWPEDLSEPNDRLMNQLMYVPPNYDPTTAKIKTIYLSTNDEDWKLKEGKEEFKNCPVSSCSLIHEEQNADLIFFKVRSLFSLFTNVFSCFVIFRMKFLNTQNGRNL